MPDSPAIAEEAPEAMDVGAEPADEIPTALTEDELTAATEALLFAAAEPLKIETLARALGKGVRREAVAAALARLNEFYATRAFTLVETAGKFALMSRAQYAPFIRRLYGNKAAKEEKISPAMLDTLAIVAYKQPVTRAEIETVRGVGCGQLLRQLLERGLVRVTGKKMDVIGYPALYGTTEQFLREFGLPSPAELPMLAELRQMKIIDDEATGETPNNADAESENSAETARSPDNASTT
ncbi:segregation and condensation protein B [Planctomycetales bacterium]|nr:segregation and condensation protein B [Planctomycetales bacterium]GHT04848.1 segregation and condensation protein B [Planctomycetales bacterium]